MTGLPDGPGLQPGNDPDAIAAVAILVAHYARDAADHRELAEMIGVPVIDAPVLQVRPLAPPRARQRPRCRKCGYLRTAPGHRLKCEGGS